ncbi:MAG: family N-acetyltransferase [Acidimicrobiaceae bacterium]|nr:family N-acetyltransferase [Acidimicrobiaceae bacterium]
MDDSGEERRFCWDPLLDEVLEERLWRVWVDATNAGGALGFLPPLALEPIPPRAEAAFERIRQGVDHLLVASVGGEPVGWLLLERDPRPYADHWLTLKRLQVHPDHQRSGHGSALLEEARRFGTDRLGLDFLLLTVREGTGADELYRRFGYREVGRIPGAMRLSPGDDRDEILMVLRLH